MVFLSLYSKPGVVFVNSLKTQNTQNYRFVNVILTDLNAFTANYFFRSNSYGLLRIFFKSTAINQTLPGLEDFLRVVLGGERLSEEANRQRIELLRRLESVSKPPSLPPRPANLGEIYRSRVQQNNDAILSGSQVQDDGSPYLNDKTLDPVEFASQQRELSRVSNFYKTYAPQTVILGEKGSTNSGPYLSRSGISTYSRVSLFHTELLEKLIFFLITAS